MSSEDAIVSKEPAAGGTRLPGDSRAAFLAEASELLASSLDVETTLASIARLAVPHVADWCFVDLIDERGDPRRVAVAHADPSKHALADVLRRYPPVGNPANAAARTLRTGHSILVADVDSETMRESAVDATHLSAIRAVGTRSKITVALRSRERTLGVVTLLLAESPRRFGEDDVAMAEELARRAALAVDNALLFAAERRARERAEQAAVRTSQLQTLTASLSQVATRDAAAEVAAGAATAMLGAVACAVALRGEDGAIEVLGARGYPRELLETWRRTPLGVPLALPEGNRAASHVVPLLVDGRGVGALVVSLRDPRQSEDDRALLKTLGALCAQAVERARLLEGERRGRDLLRLLAEASAALGSSLEYDGTLSALARLTVPHFADGCAVDVVGEAGEITRVAAAGLAMSPSLFEPALRSGEPRMAREAPPGESYTSWMVVPLVVRARIFGALGFVTTSHRRLTSADLSVAEDLARRAALAVDHSLRYREAQAASRARDDLLAVVSHDLRTPLSVISASAAVMKRGAAAPSPERIGRAADTILRAVGRMDRLIADLLDVSLIEAQRLRVEPIPCEVPSIMAEAAEFLRPLAAQKRQLFELDVPPALPIVRCDRGRTLQVLSNLGSNAIKFTGEGGLIALRAHAGDSGAVVFSVSDSGPGLSREESDRVFDRYWRARGATREGAGLGLSIAKAIVEGHGGRIWVESAPGAGCTFSFTLPEA